MSAAMQMSGTRLAYVVVQQEGEVERLYTIWDRKQKKYTREMREEPAGYLVYFPRGHVIRVKDLRTLRHYHLDKDAPIINMDGLADPNTPLGRLMLAQDTDARIRAMDDLKQMVVKMTESVAGRVTLTRVEERNPELDEMEY